MTRVSWKMPSNHIFRIIHFKVWKVFEGVRMQTNERKGNFPNQPFTQRNPWNVRPELKSIDRETRKSMLYYTHRTEHVTTTRLYCIWRWSGCLPMYIEDMRLIRSREEDNMYTNEDKEKWRYINGIKLNWYNK